MIAFLRSTSAILTSVFLLGCTFQNHEEAFTFIEKGQPRVFSLDLFNSRDTLYVGRTTLLEFDPPDANIVGYTLFLGGKKISESDVGGIGQYFIIPENYQAGYQILRLEYYQKTNSGSLADKLHNEVFTISFEKVLLIDNAFVYPLRITKTEIVDSTLVIHWNTFTGYKFGHYRIMAMDFDTTVYDSDVDHIAIPNFGGGSTSFNFEVKAKDEYKFTVVTYTYDLHVRAEQRKADSVAVSWDPSPFKALKGMNLQFRDYVNKDVQLLTGTRGIDTLLYFPVTFPYKYSLGATTVVYPHGHEAVLPQLILRSMSAQGISGSVFRQINQHDFLVTRYDAYSGTDRDNAYVYNLSTNTTKASLRGVIATSFDGKSIYSVSRLSNNRVDIERYDGNNLTTANSDRVFTLPAGGTQYQWIWSAHASTDQYILILYGPSQYFPSYYLTYHWPTMSIVYSGVFAGNQIEKPAKTGWLTEGGRYFINSSLYFDLSVSPLVVTLTNRDYQFFEVTNLPNRNQYLLYESYRKELQLRTLLSTNDPPVLTIPIYGVYMTVAYNEYNHAAVLLKKSDNTYWVEVYNLDTGLATGRIQMSSQVIETKIYEIKLFGQFLWLKVSDPINQVAYLHQFDFDL